MTKTFPYAIAVLCLSLAGQGCSDLYPKKIEAQVPGVVGIGVELAQLQKEALLINTEVINIHEHIALDTITRQLTDPTNLQKGINTDAQLCNLAKDTPEQGIFPCIPEDAQEKFSAFLARHRVDLAGIAHGGTIEKASLFASELDATKPDYHENPYFYLLRGALAGIIKADPDKSLSFFYTGLVENPRHPNLNFYTALFQSEAARYGYLIPIDTLETALTTVKMAEALVKRKMPAIPVGSEANILKDLLNKLETREALYLNMIAYSFALEGSKRWKAISERYIETALSITCGKIRWQHYGICGYYDKSQAPEIAESEELYVAVLDTKGYVKYRFADSEEEVKQAKKILLDAMEKSVLFPQPQNVRLINAHLREVELKLRQIEVERQYGEVQKILHKTVQ